MTTLPTSSGPKSRRAAPLAPPERRAAIVAATVPLVRARGTSVTTRQIAEAAGVAEGTLFAVFSDKDELLRAAVEAAVDPAPVRDALAAIPRTLPLEERLERAVTVLQAHLAGAWHLWSMPGVGRLMEASRRTASPRPVFDLAELVGLFAPDADALCCEPARAAQLLVGLTLGASHPSIVGDARPSPRELVRVLLDGVRSGDGRSC